MKLLEDKILAEGIAESENILKVDSFINHQVDPELMKKMGKDIAEHYKGKGITRIATIESSGIAPALMAAEALGVPLVILKKHTVLPEDKKSPSISCAVLLGPSADAISWYHLSSLSGCICQYNLIGFIGLPPDIASTQLE